MKVFSIVLAGRGEGLCILTKKGLIPFGNIQNQTGITLKKPTLILSNSNFYYIKKSPLPNNGWKWVPLTSLKKLNQNYGEMLCEALGKSWKIMPGYKINIQFPRLFKVANLKNEAIFFPGTFNPWHKGHWVCLNHCPKKSKIIIVPDNNPWKPVRNYECKWKIYRDICLKIKDTPSSVYPGFLGIIGKNPTINWFPKIKVRKKALLLGDDNFLNLINWKKSEKLISSIDQIYVVPRIGIPVQIEKMRQKLWDLNPKLKIKILPSHKYQGISSTKIRGD
jgi:nicotinic acid mononucleotide adenylyltransferase